MEKRGRGIPYWRPGIDLQIQEVKVGGLLIKTFKERTEEKKGLDDAAT